jgi:hypothetical protein
MDGWRHIKSYVCPPHTSTTAKVPTKSPAAAADNAYKKEGGFLRDTFGGGEKICGRQKIDCWLAPGP